MNELNYIKAVLNLNEIICPKCREALLWVGDELGDEGEVISIHTCDPCSVEVLIK